MGAVQNLYREEKQTVFEIIYKVECNQSKTANSIKNRQSI